MCMSHPQWHYALMGRIGGDCKEIHTVSHSYPLQLKQGLSRKGVVQVLRQMLSKHEARQSSFCK